MAADKIAPANGRVVTRVALPVLGIGAGELGDKRGAVLHALLGGLANEAADRGIDILLVTPDAAVYSAAQHARRSSHDHAPQWQLSSAELDEAQRLGRLARSGHLALFLGDGVSMAAGLPAWKDLLKLVARGCELPADFDRLGPLDQAENLAGLLGPEQLNARVVDCIERPIPKVALAHAFLVSLGAKEAVTTNYDDRYERAAEAAGRRRPAVLPWEAPDEVAQWLLKLHGDSKRPDSVVLTRRDFVIVRCALPSGWFAPAGDPAHQTSAGGWSVPRG